MLSHVSNVLKRYQSLQVTGWPGCVLCGGKIISSEVAVMFHSVTGCLVEYGVVVTLELMLVELVVELLLEGVVVAVLVGISPTPTQ
jgi:hypothetical protein